jgi:predicted HAD superfamily phosphohydrolase YqeG
VATTILGCSEIATRTTETTEQINTVVLQQESVQLLGTDRDETLIDLDQNEKGEVTPID